MRRESWRKANARRHALIEREIAGTLTPAETTELAALQQRADELVRPSILAMIARIDADAPPKEIPS